MADDAGIVQTGCPLCGGLGLQLVRVGNAYAHFDQGDYEMVPCSCPVGVEYERNATRRHEERQQREQGAP